MAKATGMEAVLEKANAAGKGRKAVMRRKGAGPMGGKGPGVAIMIAVGKPKPGKMAAEADEQPKSKADAKRLAAIDEQIAALKAERALLLNEPSDDDEMDDEMDDESEDESEDDED